MWVVADLDDDYIAKMEDVLEVYERPHDPQQPVICLDEKPVTLHADVRPSSPAAPGREARRDNEYERRGNANVFCGCHLGDGIPGSENDSLGDGQPQHPPPEGAGGCLRRGNGRGSLESFHRPLHAHPRKLAQSGGDRNRDLLAAMSRQSTNPQSQNSVPRGESLEPAHEPRPYQDQLEIRLQSRPSQIRL